jgi:enoyl-CoA hydratase/carnithine racemase
MPSNLLIKKENAITTVTLNRPDKLNALNKDMLDEFKNLVEVLETDKTTRALIITGQGDKAFCAGADLKERQAMNEKDILTRLEFMKTLYLRFEKLPIPIFCAINGIALGGGLELALSCDFRIASENAILGVPEVELGIIPGNGGTQRLTRIVGVAKALELVLMARRISPEEALKIGLVHAVVPPGLASGQALVWATKILEVGPIAIKQAKAGIKQGFQKPLEEALSFEIECYKPCLYSKDRQEALKAFNEKRKPQFKGE